jgi:GT2 family glycosyltransferase
MPLTTVTISILNYQRKETLRLVLEHALAQEYPNLDFVVVDNASTDGSDRMVEEEFPAVRLIRLPENIGCAARNAGVGAAKGEIVVTVDNDVLLRSPDAVEKAVEALQRRPSVACVNFKILDATGSLSQHDWCHPRDWRRFADEEFLTDYVLEGASAWRRQAFERAGGYWAPYFLGHEGLDLALRLLDAGYDLLYSPGVEVTHLVSPEARPSTRIYYTFTRNGVWVALRNHRLGAAVRAIVRDLILMAFSSARAGQWRSFLRGIRDGFAGAGSAWASRAPLNRTTYRRLRELRALEPGVVEKAKRHWRERPI